MDQALRLLAQLAAPQQASPQQASPPQAPPHQITEASLQTLLSLSTPSQLQSQGLTSQVLPALQLLQALLALLQPPPQTLASQAPAAPQASQALPPTLLSKASELEPIFQRMVLEQSHEKRTLDIIREELTRQLVGDLTVEQRKQLYEVRSNPDQLALVFKQEMDKAKSE
ncbi:hypothetical protein GQX73_g10590 [Xylaria multiplex]|uniref:Uncharacterized protein n=1 Tax=Xylaria multiplex TaxID=323545 RepID=A0A7C8MWV7_9PEZI|nr:hypothetical protein GQX73_g10590 [Xylaria multiplex]